jgi:hypothetical protein
MFEGRILSTQVTSLAAVGRGRTLESALEAVASRHQVVELTIGCLPGEEPLPHMTRLNLSAIAHHATPTVTGAIKHPETTPPCVMASELNALGVKFYSLHPPKAASSVTPESHAAKWFAAMDEYQIPCALETMYPLVTNGITRKEYSMDSGCETLRYVRAMQAAGYERPLVADMAHINIGLKHGFWDLAQVRELVRSGCVAALHYSSNNGDRDEHRSLSSQDAAIHELLHEFSSAGHAYEVDEGRS